MLLPCSQINTRARSAFLSLRAACWKRKSLWANQGGTASYCQCLSGGLFSLACQAPLQLTAATCKQTPKWCWPDSPGGVMFVPCCHGTAPLHDQRRVYNLTQVLTSAQLLLTPTPVKTHQSHTQTGALSTQGMEPVLEISPVPSQPTNAS